MEKLPRASELLKKSWDRFTAKWRLYVGISVIPAVIALAMAIGGGLIALVTIALSGLMGGESAEAIGFALLAIMLLLAIVAGIVIALWSQVALISAILREDAPTIREAYLRTKHKIRPYFWTSILTFLVVLLGFILLIVPGVIFSLWYSVVAFIVVGEDMRGTSAMKRSKFYVAGYTGEVFGKFFYLGVIWLAIWIGLNIGLSMILRSEEVVNIVLQILGVLVGPLWMIYAANIYRELKLRKTGPSAEPVSAPAAAPAA